MKNEFQRGSYYVVPPFAKAELVQPPLDLLIIFATPLLDQCRERNKNKKRSLHSIALKFNSLAIA